MITGLPNFAVCMGYTNASWTLRADLTSRLVCKVLNYMDAHDFAAVVPLPREELEERPLLDLARATCSARSPTSRARATAVRGGCGRTTSSTR